MKKPEASEPKPAVPRSACPVAGVLDILGDKWTLIVVRDLFLDKHRYGDFLASPEGIPTNILADRLKRLEAAGIVRRELYRENPPRAEYFLTPRGADLGPVLRAMAQWGLQHLPGAKLLFIGAKFQEKLERPEIRE